MDLDNAVKKTKANFQIPERQKEESEVIEKYGQIFNSSNLESLSKDQFKSFLLIKNNKHWNGIHRRGNDITDDMDKLKEALGILLDENKDIEERFDILIPKNKPKFIKWLGQAILTPILLVVYPEKYGVYNNVTLQALEKLDLRPKFGRGTSFAKEYAAINNTLLDISKKYNLSLFELDEVWWNVLDEKNPPDVENIGYIISQIGKEIELMNKNKLQTITAEDKLYKLTNEDFPNALESTVKDFKFNNNFLFKGSAGQGNRTSCPWGVILDSRITNTPQEGFYPVYLFDKDGKNVFLSLNQGATIVEKDNNRSEPQTKKALKEKADFYRKILNEHTHLSLKKYSADNIELATPKLCGYYEKGNICAIAYDVQNLPSEKNIKNDLKGILNLYNQLIEYTKSGNSHRSFYNYLINLGYFFESEIIENFLLSLKVKPFVILTGNSGTGKTKLAQMFAQYLMKKEGRNENSIITKVKPNLSSIKYSAWTLDRSDLEPLHLDLEKNFDIEVDNLPGKAKLSMSPRLWYEDPDGKIRSMLENLANKDPDKEIELKLITESTDESKYEIVSVGANWTENRHLLGFHNVINGNYQTTQALNLILQASQDKINPYFMILDEMNLSHVERYFADFLSAMESDEPINLHNNDYLEIPQELEIPLNLLVLGTVNVDETTYMFSPKVLDRANTIEFETYPAKNYMIDDHEIDSPSGDINYLENPLSDIETRNFTIEDLKEKLKDVKINSNDYLWAVLAEEINSFQESLGKAGFDFGFRVINEILRFMYVAWVYEGRQEIWDNWMRYFDAQIKQKMLPKLHGSQRVLEEVLREIFELCYLEAVDSAPRYFDNLDSDPSVKYLSSALKIQEMDKVLNEQRYVSFIN